MSFCGGSWEGGDTLLPDRYSDMSLSSVQLMSFCKDLYFCAEVTPRCFVYQKVRARAVRTRDDCDTCYSTLRDFGNGGRGFLCIKVRSQADQAGRFSDLQTERHAIKQLDRQIIKPTDRHAVRQGLELEISQTGS